jgi:predicted deacylase
MPTDSKQSGRARSTRSTTDSKSRKSRNGRVNPTEAARAAAGALSELTGRRVESVLGLHRDDDGWKVMLEVLELSRVPTSTDLLGSYAVSVDDDGELVGYERTGRYQRGQSRGDNQ